MIIVKHKTIRKDRIKEYVYYEYEKSLITEVNE
jgi:hypothetical protein